MNTLVLELKEKLGLKQLIGESPAFIAEIEKLPPLARCDATVLITGETGTGKEMFARAIHFLSPRSPKSFSPLNCGAIPVDLVENELFGHEPGAFTGANSSSAGLLRENDGGSLFLDEIDCLPLMAQVKLLRFLQEKEFRPLGAHKACRADVRVIAASNANLEQAVKEKRFRQDLFYRLNVIGLALPPLRERKDDIPMLARHFVAKYGAAFDAPARDLTQDAAQKLMLYDWPGNVRELENVIERSVVFSRQRVLRMEDIELPNRVAVEPGKSFQALKAQAIARFECEYIRDLLRAHNGNITRAARASGKHRRAFWEMMRKYRITAQPEASLELPQPCNSSTTANQRR
jgi:two-component system, NtrC family, response regulator GlrR